MILETTRLIIRELMEEDWIPVHQYCSDEEVTKYTFWGPNTEEETRAYLRTVIENQQADPRYYFEWAITLKETGKLIGTCCILRNRETNAEIGYTLSREFWGRGYTTEAARALLAVGFRELGVHRIFATCRPANIGSYRVMEKIGMTREGLLREHIRAKGKWLDSYQYSILEHEYDRGES